MVRPTSFGFDIETAKSNAFQNEPVASDNTTLARANDEFEKMVTTLTAYGIDVVVVEDSPVPPKPNAVFPNNWLSMWPDGHIFLYPMATQSRRIERTDLALNILKNRFVVNKITNLSDYENQHRYLESTGVMIFNHQTKTAYGCLSIRCNAALFTMHAGELQYKPIVFHAVDEAGIPIYHTNVMMGVQSSTAVVCLEAVRDEKEKDQLRTSLENAGLTIVDITYRQMNSFCGNVLELHNPQGERFLALSQTAYDAFTLEQREILSLDKTLIPLAIPTIELVGGGSVRCMLAEIFLQKLS
jgi:hypothetical protein